jgi:hypothetical protein
VTTWIKRRFFDDVEKFEKHYSKSWSRFYAQSCILIKLLPNWEWILLFGAFFHTWSHWVDREGGARGLTTIKYLVPCSCGKFPKGNKIMAWKIYLHELFFKDSAAIRKNERLIISVKGLIWFRTSSDNAGKGTDQSAFAWACGKVNRFTIAHVSAQRIAWKSARSETGLPVNNRFYEVYAFSWLKLWVKGSRCGSESPISRKLSSSRCIALRYTEAAKWSCCWLP